MTTKSWQVVSDDVDTIIAGEYIQHFCGPAETEKPTPAMTPEIVVEDTTTTAEPEEEGGTNYMLWIVASLILVPLAGALVLRVCFGKKSAKEERQISPKKSSNRQKRSVSSAPDDVEKPLVQDAIDRESSYVAYPSSEQLNQLGDQPSSYVRRAVPPYDNLGGSSGQLANANSAAAAMAANATSAAASMGTGFAASDRSPSFVPPATGPLAPPTFVPTPAPAAFGGSVAQAPAALRTQVQRPSASQQGRPYVAPMSAGYGIAQQFAAPVATGMSAPYGSAPQFAAPVATGGAFAMARGGF